ncbi:MAG: sugar-binding transcriptional regulator [Alphaproteobacteria bacterium]|nr:sugar-binding transcriptional regulator [Alphaproteobacteria bacterium]
MASISKRRSSGQVSGDEIVVETAWLYYHDELNQTEIAKKLDVSRATVVNYLQEAREKGFIRLTLSPSVFSGHKLSHILRKRFGLKSVLIIPDGDKQEAQKSERVARAAAEWLPDLLEVGDTLGVAWGQTLFQVADSLVASPIKDLKVVQLIGSMATPYGFDAEIVSANLALGLGAQCVNLHAPAVLTSVELAKQLKAEPIISKQLEALKDCNKAIFAAGSCTPESHVVSGGLATQSDLKYYISKGAVGVLCGQFIDGNGKAVAGPLEERIIGVELKNLVGLEMGLLVSAGVDKARAMLAVMKGGYTTHLVTNATTAAKIITLADEENI